MPPPQEDSLSLSRLARVALIALALTACQTVGGENQPKRFSTAVDRVVVTPSSKVMVVYVGAYNCPYCLSWESAKDSVIARLRAKGVEYREAVSPSYIEVMWWTALPPSVIGGKLTSSKKPTQRGRPWKRW